MEFVSDKIDRWDQNSQNMMLSLDFFIQNSAEHSKIFKPVVLREEYFL